MPAVRHNAVIITNKYRVRVISFRYAVYIVSFAAGCLQISFRFDCADRNKYTPNTAISGSSGYRNLACTNTK
jgi:hypothetical protein